MIIKKKSHISTDELIHRIEYADDSEIDAIIDALQRRYKRLFPDWEVHSSPCPLETRKTAGTRPGC